MVNYTKEKKTTALLNLILWNKIQNGLEEIIKQQQLVDNFSITPSDCIFNEKLRKWLCKHNRVIEPIYDFDGGQSQIKQAVEEI